MSGEEVRAWRRAHHLTQVALAEHLHVSAKTIKRWEGGHVPAPQYLPIVLDWLHQRLDSTPVF